MQPRLEEGDLVVIFGGAGFIGRHTVQALAKRGLRIRAAVRRPDLAGHLQPLGNVGQIHAVQANVRHPDSVRAAVKGARAVINLVGILAERGRQTFEAVHIEGARTVARAAREGEAAALVHLSAIGADARARARYARSKAAGEVAVLEEFPEAVVLRPSIVFGPEDQFFNRFAAMARLSPALPLIGGGKTRFQPVYVGDVARAISAMLEGWAQVNESGAIGEGGAIYELGGPEVLSFRALLERVLHYTGRKRWLVPIPFWLATLQALLMSPLPNPPLTVDQVRLLKRDNVVSDEAKARGRTLEGLGISPPTAIDLVVPQYLERFAPKGQYSHYRG